MKVGIYNRWLATLGGGEQYSLAIADVLSRDHEVQVISHGSVSTEEVSHRLGIDLDRVTFVTTPAARAEHLEPLTTQYDLFINASNWDFVPSAARHSVLVVYFPLAPTDNISGHLRYRIGRGLNSPMLKPTHLLLSAIGFEDLRGRLENLIPPNFLDQVRTYERIWAISSYVQQWTQRYWQMESDLLYPSVAVEQFGSAEKRQQILTVGRFFAGSHNKKHGMMITAFRELIEEGLTGWELHLVGGVNKGDAHRRYLDTVREAADGLPVVLHTDIPFEELQQLYAESALYWHASGYGEDSAAAPHRFEHFGITTVEAMAAGCVPVVIARGGQPELVSHGESGFLWESQEELKGYTRTLIDDPDLRQRMGQQSIAASRRFDRQHFEERLSRLLQAFN